MADTYPKNTIDDDGLKKVWGMAMAEVDLKVDKEAGKGLSTNDYTTTEKNKLEGIESGAEVNTVTSVAGKTGDVTLTKSDVGLSNVGNFKAVSTSANQGLTDTEKSNARANIDTPSNGDIESSKTIKSSVVTVNDAAPMNAEDITVDITPVQDLHGYDRPWAGGAWKNKLPMTVAGIKALNTDGTWSGNTYTCRGVTVVMLVDSGNNITGFRLSGTASENMSFYLVRKAGLDILPSGSYIMDGCPAGGAGDGSTYYMGFYAPGKSKYDMGSGTTISLSGNEDESANIFIRISSGYAIQGSLLYYPMIRLATETDPTFAPYSNICPIEGRTGAEVVDAGGENKFTDVWTQDKSFNTSGELIAGSDRCATINGNRIKGGTTYKFLYDSNVSDIQFGTFFYDANDSFIELHSWEDSGYTFTTPSNAAIVRFNYKSSTAPTNTQLLEVHTATITFGETVYGCTVDFNTGKTVVDSVKKIYDGTEQWSGIQNRRYVEESTLAKLSNYIESIYCDKMQTVANAENLTPADCVTGYRDAYSTYDSNWLYMNVSADTGTQAFLDWLNTNKPEVVFRLATPYTLTLTPAQLKMLKGTNTLTSNGATITLKYQPDNVIGELKGEIRAVEAELAEVEENLEIVYEDHVANTSMGIIVDGYSVGDMPFSNALDIAKPGYTPIAVTDTSVVLSSVADQGEIATHCLLDVTNNRVRFYVHVMDSAASLTIPPNSLTFRVAYKKA